MGSRWDTVPRRGGREMKCGGPETSVRGALLREVNGGADDGYEGSGAGSGCEAFRVGGDGGCGDRPSQESSEQLQGAG